MFLAALILLLIAVLLVVAALFGGDSYASLDFGAFSLNTTSTTVFFLGMATLLLIVLSLWMMRAAGRATRNRRREAKRVEAESSVEPVEGE